MRRPTAAQAWHAFCCSVLLAPLALADQVLSRVVSTKYGRVQGAIRHHATPALPPVELFLGVPYASPPTGEGRFTPTSSPLPWESVRRCLELPPVCPQPLPDSAYHPGALPPDRVEYLKSLRPLLQRQSEDCLYLNIYTPHDGGGRYPVMVFIQGEAFWWGSGNLYDGGVLASYGHVVVVTINYRLGPLGFLNTSPTGSRRKVVGNQGLMDQLAALSWVHENIAYFGGDAGRITLFGHAAGAACITFLMVSPVLVPGLFHRAILMSGSAFSEWAEVEAGISVTARLAKVLNCSLPSDLSDQHPETILCLRNISAQALVNAPMPQYKFASLFGPSVDGVVITDDYRTRIARELKGRNMSIIVGVTEGDAYPELTHRQSTEGLSIKERNRIFRTFVRNSYHHHLQEIYLAMAKEYTDWGNPSHHPFEVRDLAVEALNDGAFVAPMTKMAEVVSNRADTYMYVYTHHDREHQRLGSVFASELNLVFGAPFHDPTTYPLPHSSRSSSLVSYQHSSTSFGSSFLSGAGTSSREVEASKEFTPNRGFTPGTMELPIAWVAPANYSRNDALVSEILMKFWTNFARSGSPNSHDETRPRLTYPEKTRLRNLTWQQYDPVYKTYLEISPRPRVRDHYRAHKVALWNWLLPELQEAGTRYPELNAEAWYSADSPEYFVGPVRPIDPFRFLEPTDRSFTSPLPMLPSPRNEYLGPNVSAAHGSVRYKNMTENKSLEKGGPLLDYTTALTLTVAIGLSLLVLNVILFAALLYRRDRNQLGSKINYDSVSVQPLCTVDSGLRTGSSTGHGSVTPPGKDMITSCPADIQVTELHTFPTPPDIGDRNTEVTYTSSGGKKHGCSAMPTSQFVPPPPLLTSSAASAHTQQLEGGITSPAGTIVSCNSGGGVSSPCTSSCYPASTSPYRPDAGSPYPDMHLVSNAGNESYQISVGMGGKNASSNAAGGAVGGGASCTGGGSCQVSGQSSKFPPTASNYCPPVQYCNEYPVSQYSDRYVSSPSQISSAACQFSNDNACTFSSPVLRQHSAGQGSILGIRSSTDSANQRSATLNRASPAAAGSNPACLQGVRKPKPPPRDDAPGPGFATLPRQSSLDGTTHILA